MSETPQFMLCLGSNTPCRTEIISSVIERIARLCRIVVKSSMYEAPDESGLGAPYVNIVLSVEPSMTLDDFRTELKELELQYGRDAHSKSIGVMPLDADIIIWDGEIIDPYQYSREYFKIGYREIT
ncbi:MAG: 2-amino-4-hydroxy-6-hydroxymethyldihydropteridine diphosphokinase, partial [Muribaculaceae bacterium]|nr:2-amino-4-hydroxy-6-hydroxymethyldihydropteridine diphosphokinase [Muribaculaceae bacterium]